MSRVIREHARDVSGIIALVLAGLLTAGLILSRQSAALPRWVPLFGPDTVEIRAELATAQGVVANQGHTVNLAGVQIGTVTGVDLGDGVAIVTLGIDRSQLDQIHPDAAALLRPRTGLQDMTIEIDPGVEPGAIEPGSTIESDRSAPNVHVDQVLAGLDADTRSYLKLLLAGGRGGLGGNARDLSAGLRRLEPTVRDVAKVATALEGRRDAVGRAITALANLADEVAAHDAELARFITASERSLGGIAAQQAPLRSALRGLPPTLRRTRAALAGLGTLSGELEPALAELEPVAKRTGPALDSLATLFGETTPVLRTEIRPLTRRVRGPVRSLTRPAPALERSSKGLAGTTKQLAALLDALAHNPEGREEGYLFWLSWLAHNTGSLFTTRDANGSLRRGLIMVSCQTAGLAEGVAASRPFFRTALDLTRLPTSAEVC